MPPIDFAPALPPAAWGVLGGLAGAIAGSWIGTAAVRWPEGRATARGRSACDACGATLGAAELVPILSWVALGGRCRRCGARIDPRHPASEVAAALIGAGALSLAPGPAGVAGAAFGWALLLLALTDVADLWLPDRVTLPLLAGGLAVGALGVAPPFAERAIGAAAGFLALGAVRLAYRRLRGREGMGAGDPKLFAAIGAWLGWAALPIVLLLASAVGLALAGAAALGGRRVTLASEVPLGALLALAAMAAWVATTLGLLPR